MKLVSLTLSSETAGALDDTPLFQAQHKAHVAPTCHRTPSGPASHSAHIRSKVNCQNEFNVRRKIPVGRNDRNVLMMTMTRKSSLCPS
jgi:hypothetical protein